jgi:hypothetical protein
MCPTGLETYGSFRASQMIDKLGSTRSSLTESKLWEGVEAVVSIRSSRSAMPNHLAIGISYWQTRDVREMTLCLHLKQGLDAVIWRT